MVCNISGGDGGSINPTGGGVPGVLGGDQIVGELLGGNESGGGGGDAGSRDILSDAYQKGWERLYQASRFIDPRDPKFRKECADFLKGKTGSVEKLLEFFQNLAAGTGGNIKFTPVPNRQLTNGWIHPADTIIKGNGKVIITFWGQFFDATKKDAKSVGLNSVEDLQLALIFHELGHATEIGEASHSDTPEGSNAYNKMIIEKCLK